VRDLRGVDPLACRCTLRGGSGGEGGGLDNDRSRARWAAHGSEGSRGSAESDRNGRSALRLRVNERAGQGEGKVLDLGKEVLMEPMAVCLAMVARRETKAKGAHLLLSCAAGSESSFLFNLPDVTSTGRRELEVAIVRRRRGRL
jgi:hypothetical protein